jgi:hypothetical protein
VRAGNEKRGKNGCHQSKSRKMKLRRKESRQGEGEKLRKQRGRGTPAQAQKRTTVETVRESPGHIAWLEYKAR